MMAIRGETNDLPARVFRDFCGVADTTGNVGATRERISRDK
jgi:hypothetical protein